MKKILILLIFIIPIAAICCDMIAVVGKITKDRQNFAIEFLKSRSNSRANNDGYGIAWFNSEWHSQFKSGKRRWFGDGDKEALDEVEDWKIGESEHTETFLLHARDASKGYGNHPFFLEMNDREWAFMHNGKLTKDLQSYMFDYLGDYWFSIHHSNWVEDVTNIVDSELFFHYLTARMEKGAEISDILSDIRFIEKNTSKKSVLNFVMTNGEILYAYRNSPAKDFKHKLSWQLEKETLIVKTDRKIGKMLEPEELLYYKAGQVDLEIIR